MPSPTNPETDKSLRAQLRELHKKAREIKDDKGRLEIDAQIEALLAESVEAVPTPTAPAAPGGAQLRERPLMSEDTGAAILDKFRTVEEKVDYLIQEQEAQPSIIEVERKKRTFAPW